MIAANKMDAVYDHRASDSIVTMLRKEFEPQGIKVFPISAVTRQGVKELLFHVNELLKTADNGPLIFEKEFEIQYQGDRSLPYAVERFDFFQKFLKSTGILDDLEKAGIEEGDTVRMYGLEFDYYK